MAKTDVKATYRGIAFPFGKGSTSLPAGATDAVLVKDSIKQIILTTPGERVMRPDFGCNAYSFVFENNDEILAELIRTEVTGALGRYEPRIAVRGVSVERDASEVVITISYILNLTGQQDSIAVPVPTNQS